MRIISFMTLPSTVERILLHLDLPQRPPRVSPARGPPQAELDLDQTPAFDLADPEPIPEYEFDRARPHPAFPSTEGVWISYPSRSIGVGEIMGG